MTCSEVKNLHVMGPVEILTTALEMADQYRHMIIIVEDVEGYVQVGNTAMTYPFSVGMLELGKRELMRRHGDE